jgi:toxin-antitoxin system PIN domain toxin
MRSYFPDINVWVALTYRGHQHHPIAAAWFDRLQGDTAGFCRLTQIGFLRLLTHPQVMGKEVRTQSEAWQAYEELSSDPRVIFYPESDQEEVHAEFKALSTSGRSSPQQWPDAYLAAFAHAEGLVLVTFDRALSKLAGRGTMLLK